MCDPRSSYLQIWRHSDSVCVSVRVYIMNAYMKLDASLCHYRTYPIYFIGIFARSSGSSRQNESGQQHLVIQPIEFDHMHKNLYGYFALATFILVLINYLLIKERNCQISLASGVEHFSLIQSFHMVVLVIAILVFVLSYFNFAVVIYDFKLLFYTSAALILMCVGFLIYNVVAIVSAPCVSSAKGGVLSIIDTSAILEGKEDIFSAHDGIGITVFVLDILAAALMFVTVRNFYIRC